MRMTNERRVSGALLIRSSPEALNYTGTPILFFVLRFIKFVFARRENQHARRARYPDRCSGACSKRRLAGEKIGATGFEPATCRRGDRVRFCNKALFVPLHDGLRNFRCESGSRERRAWLLSSDRYCDDEDGGEDFRTSQHSGVQFFDFAKHNSGTQR